MSLGEVNVTRIESPTCALICAYQQPSAMRFLSPANCLAYGFPALEQPSERSGPLKSPSADVA